MRESLREIFAALDRLGPTAPAAPAAVPAGPCACASYGLCVAHATFSGIGPS